MTPIAVIEAAATFLWTYAALAGASWLNAARQLETRGHIPALAELLGNLVPAMILLVIVVLVGALVGLPSVVVLIALLFPAGLAYGLHMSLRDLIDHPPPNATLIRIGLSLIIGAGVILLRQGG